MNMHASLLKHGLGATSIALPLASLSCGEPTPPDGGLDANVDAADGGGDSPYVPLDTGPEGAALMPVDACDDLVDDLYRTPSGLPPFEPGVRGELLGCAMTRTFTAAQVTSRLSGAPGLTVGAGGIREYVIAYRTEREPRGVGGISTALVYLPDVAIGERVPMVVVAHGTLGVADVCAPSRFVRDGSGASSLPESYLDALLLPFAARGLPVVVPDYAGLGTEGMHGYGNWYDPARSTLDGARALERLLPAARLDGGTILSGHSQGGGVALAAEALAAEAPDVDIRAIVATAPGYRLAPLASFLGSRTLALNPLLRAVAAFALYADYANLTPDEARWGDALASPVRAHMTSLMSAQCFVGAGMAMDVAAPGYVPPTTVGELLDGAFVADVAACTGGGSCDGLPGAWVARDAANDPHLASGAPPILVVASDRDADATPGSVGCVLSRLSADGASTEACTVSEGDHLGVVSGTAAYGIEWALAAAAGAATPPCPGSRTRPRCVPF